ncbi:MAG: GNAT family N-acetyltransferase [Clostridia bacterium]|nr:GNAT family N-acetyltransferase [Clostridia bacterium]
MEKQRTEQKPRLFITIEDEEELLEAGVPAIVPVVFCRYKSKIELECYYGIYPQAREFLLNCDNPFSKESLLQFDALIAPYLEEIGYERPEQGKLRYYRSMVLWDRRELKREAILPSSKMLTPKLLLKIRENPTDFDLQELLQKDLPAAVTVVDGVLVSIATVNEHSEGQRLLEAAVYTHPAHRARGYGSSNVALLADRLLMQKKGVVYCCSCRNQISLRLARQLGFRCESRFYAVDAYKIGQCPQEQEQEE